MRIKPRCFVCGEKIEEDGRGMTAVRTNLAPFYTEIYAWCEEHVPDDPEEAKRRIKSGDIRVME